MALSTALLAGALALALIQTSAASAQPAHVQVITLGTGGGPLTRLKRAESANAVVIGDDVYVVDAGDRVLQQLEAAHIDLARVRAIFITHYHQDHVGGLAALLGIRWMTNVPGRLKLLGPPGMRQIVEGFRTAMQPSVDAGFGKTADPLAELEVHEVGEGPIYADENLRVSAVENTHYSAPVADPSRKPKSYAYRLETPAGVVVFTGDTAASDKVAELARGADLLVAETISVEATVAEIDRRTGGKLAPEIRANMVRHLADDHLLPAQVGDLATRAGVKQVVISHLSPGLDSETPAVAEKLYGAGARASFKGPLTLAADLQAFTLSRGK